MASPTQESSLERHGLALALLAGLLARLVLISALFEWSAEPLFHDDATYVRFARGLLETGRLDTHHFPVGYVLFVATFLKVFGGVAFQAIRVAHVLLGLFTVVIVSRIAGGFYGRRAGLLAAWMTALYPPLVFMNGRVMSETLFIALLMTSVHLFIEGDRRQHLGRLCLAGVLFALGSIVRSNLVLMIPFIPLWLLWRRGGGIRWARLVPSAVCTAATVAVLMLPGLYFLSTKGEFIPFATNSGQTFYGANNPLANGGWIEVQDHPELLQSIPAPVRESPSAYSKAQSALAVKWIKEHPGGFLRLLPRKLLNAWIPGFQDSETTRDSRLANLVLGLCFGVVVLAAIVGRLRVQPAERDGLLLAILATYTAMSLIFYGNPRIGLFCSPSLIVYASSIILIRQRKSAAI